MEQTVKLSGGVNAAHSRRAAPLEGQGQEGRHGEPGFLGYCASPFQLVLIQHRLHFMMQ